MPIGSCGGVGPAGRSLRSPARGFTYLWLLLVVALSAVSLVAWGQWWYSTGQRERERELIFRGEQIAQALASYRSARGVGPPRWPRTLDELVQDKRGSVDRHHLRQPYADPLATDGQWSLITDEQGGIVGVRSTSRALAFIHREEDDPAAVAPMAAASAAVIESTAPAATASKGKTVAEHLFLAEAAMAAAEAASAAVAASAPMNTGANAGPPRPAWALELDQRSDKPASSLFQ